MFNYAWRPLHLYPLLEAVAVQEKPKSYLGVGVWKGDCLVHMLKGALPTLERLVVCDPFFGHCGGPTDPKVVEDRVRAAGYTGSYELIHDYSNPGLWNWWKPEVTIDLALIDGDHNFGPALADLRAVVPHTKVTLVHDLDHSAVWDAFRTYVQARKLPFWCTAEAQGTGIIYNAEAR